MTKTLPSLPERLARRVRRDLTAVRDAYRRRGWLLDGLTPRKAWNIVLAVAGYVTRSERVRHLPVVVKVDISPICNLRCTVCVHAESLGREGLATQQFRASQKMPMEAYARLIEEIADRSCAVSLYYLGDPYAHPHVDEMCRLAADAGLNVHVSSNFSFAFTDERIASIVESGVTHLTVCIDGLSQEAYARTRVGGRIDAVLDNTRRLLEVRAARGRKYPKVEVQYIKFPHNVSELEEAERLTTSWGIDQFTHFWGALHNYTDQDPGRYDVVAPLPAALVPHCTWPYFATLVRFDGDVIPCCSFRQGEQYRPGPRRTMGNAFAAGFAATWNSEPYRMARRAVARPASLADGSGASAHFCEACPVLFQTDIEKTERWGDQTTFERTQGALRDAAGENSGARGGRRAASSAS